MQLARVRGTVVASIKSAGLTAHKLLLVEPISPMSPYASDLPPGTAVGLTVAVDLAGAGVDEVVLVTLGSAARLDPSGQAAPTDAAVVAIVDAIQVDGETTFRKQ